MASFIDYFHPEFEKVSPEDRKPLHNETSVYKNYTPMFVTIGENHPQDLVEGAGLSCVKPPPITYRLKMEARFYQKHENDDAFLSKAQLEPIIYACQAHKSYINKDKKIRRGFLLGDGTGVGKSRVLAGILYENFKMGRKRSVWITANQGLFESAQEEMKKFLPDVEFMEVKDLESSTSGPESNSVQVLFCTYRTLTSTCKFRNIEGWLGQGFNGVLIFDEAHYAKAAYAQLKSVTGEKVCELQEKFPQARVVYSSATGASEVHHLFYLQRLGIWGEGTAYKSKLDLKEFVTKRGPGALELLAMEMKMRGVFLSRQISYQGVNLIHGKVTETEDFVHVYDKCSQLWTLIIKLANNIYQNRMNSDLNREEAIDNSFKLGNFYHSALSFFQQLVTSSKLQEADRIARTSLANNQSVIFGIQTTGEAKFKKISDEPWNLGMPYSNLMQILRFALVSLGISIGCPKLYLKGSEKFAKLGTWKNEDEAKADQTANSWNIEEEDLIFDDNGHEIAAVDLPTQGNPPPKKIKRELINHHALKSWPKYSVGFYLEKMSHVGSPDKYSWSFDTVESNLTFEGLARLYHEIALLLPINSLDELLDRFPTAAEITGRSHSYRYNPQNRQWEKKKTVGRKKEMERFMDLECRVTVVSNAGSTGFSLHSDIRRKNQLKRVHITLEYAWGPEQLLQQLGRSHRSNQKIVPTYAIIQSPIPAEVRFICVTAKRLKQMGAICQGHTMANPLAEKISDILCTDIGYTAINSAIREVCATNAETANLFKWLQIGEISKDKKCGKFLKRGNSEVCRLFNRTLVLPIATQKHFLNLVFAKLEDLQKSKEHFAYLPITDLPSHGAVVNFICKNAFLEGGENCTLYQFKYSRVMPLREVDDILKTRNWNLYFGTEMKLDVCLATQKIDKTFDAIYPYNRVPTNIPMAVFTKKWKTADKTFARMRWERKLEEITKKPGCTHAKTCSEDCLYRWGILNILVLAGFTSKYLRKIEDCFTHDFRLVRVIYKENNVMKCVAGVLIENSHKNRVKEILLGLK